MLECNFSRLFSPPEMSVQMNLFLSKFLEWVFKKYNHHLQVVIHFNCCIKNTSRFWWRYISMSSCIMAMVLSLGCCTTNLPFTLAKLMIPSLPLANLVVIPHHQQCNIPSHWEIKRKELGFEYIGLIGPTIPYHPWDGYIYLHEWLVYMVNVGKYTIHGSYGICIDIYTSVLLGNNRGFYIYIYKNVYIYISRSSSFLSGTMWNPEISSNLHCWIVQKSRTFWIYSDNIDKYRHKWTLIDIDTPKPEIWTRNLKKKKNPATYFSFPESLIMACVSTAWHFS